MPHVIVTASAHQGLERCRRFLSGKSPQAARRAAQAVTRQLLLLESHPDMGRPVADKPQWRELLIAFGNSGYVALYRYEPTEDVVYVLAFRHQKESGYS